MTEALTAGFGASVLWLCVCALAAIAGAVCVPLVKDMLARLRAAFCKSKVRGVMATVAVVGAVMYGGSKGTRNVNFPRTDIEVAYLVDAGSYVTNDLVHVAFNSYLVPQSAPIVLSYWPDGSTNEDEMVTAYAATLADFPNPLDFAFENAISNRWYCYTTWTPGPAVHTNGVWQTIWMTDRLYNLFLIPIRTVIEADGDEIAPPTFILPEEEGEPDDE